MKFAFTLLVVLASVSVAEACNIPVFRYALERWRPDECEVIVFHDAKLSAEQESLLRDALPTSGGQRRVAKVIRVNVKDRDQPQAELWSQLSSNGPKQLPYVVVRARIGNSRSVNAWRGPISEVEGWNVFDSPARSEMAKRLLAGHSVVWLLIESKDEQRNLKVKQLLETELERLSNSIALPEGIGLPGSELHSEIPLLVKFSMLEIERDDPDEEFLVDLLSSFRPNAVANDEPLVIPVFGRGRALEVIPADDLNASLLEDLTLFLSGACSCQVKEQNPGFDLLFAVDWNADLFGEGFEPPPAKTLGDRRQPQLLSIPPGR